MGHLSDIDLTGGCSNRTLLVICSTGLALIVSTLIWLSQRSSNNANARKGSAANAHHARTEEEYDRKLELANVSTLTRSQRRARAKLFKKKYLKDGNPENYADANDNTHRDLHLQTEPIPVVEQPLEEKQNVITATIKSRKERKEMAKEVENQQRQFMKEEAQLDPHQRKAQHPMVQQQDLKLEKEYSWKREIERKRQQHKYMFYVHEDEDGKNHIHVSQLHHEPQNTLKGPLLITVDDFLQELEHHPTSVQSLQEWAHRFSVTVDDLVQRLMDLEKDGRIPHLMIHSDKDCFTVLTHDGMKRISRRISKLGCITMDNLAQDLPKYLEESK